MKHLAKIVIIIVLAILLVGVRMFEDMLFYDPLMAFFKADYTLQALPPFEMTKLLLHVAFRFLINTGLSLAIIWVAFQDSGILKFSGILFAMLLVVLFTIFYLLLVTLETGNYMSLFYVRRFLIQPLFLLILLPAFYVYKNK